MKIIIPTHNRYDRLITLSFIPKSYHHNVFLVVRSGEQEERYSKAFQSRSFFEDDYENNVNILAFDGLTGIHDKRHAIAKHFKGEKIWMVDDDCILKPAEIVTPTYPNKDGKILDIIKMCKNVVTESQFYEFIEYASDLLDKYPHGIVRPGIFPRGEDYWPYRLNTWAFTNAFLNLKTLEPESLNYDFVNHTEDAVAFLSVLEQGYDSFLLSKWMIKSEKPGEPGGMTGVRNSKMMDAANEKIHKRFPAHTRLQEGYSIDGEEGHRVLKIRPNI